MASTLYHALWVAMALSVIALASALIARWLRRTDLRRTRAQQALDALAAYSEWLGGQRRTTAFQGDRPPERSPLRLLREAQQACFPELQAPLLQLLDVHTRFLDFLWRQQNLRSRDLEAWLESDHDVRFMALWSEHRLAVHGLADPLRRLAGEGLVDPEPESVFPA